ncbi:MAG: penicillin-binding protein activator [Desulfarculaceae bacterium]|nr:penicillin-binding protein activator [Desulfarculaceae bacterium]
MKYNLSMKTSVLTFFVTILSVLTFVSCAEKRPEKVEIKEKEQVAEKAAKETEKKPAEKKNTLYEVLVREARKFIQAGDIREALVFYNKALGLASESEKNKLLESVRELMARAETSTLRELSRTEDLFIPRPLVLYRLALNLALDKNYKDALRTVETFEEQYPEHPLAQDAAELKWIIEKSGFNRELIGCLLPLTGKYSFFGKRAMNGIACAVKDFRKNNPERRVRIVIKDTGSSKSQALSCAKELSDMGVAALIGPMGTARTAGRVAEEKEIPMIAMTQKKLNTAEKSFLFSNFLTPRLQARGLASYAFYRLGIRNFAILYPEDEYGKTYMDLFWKMVKEYGGQVRGVESYGPEQTDFSESLEKITGEFYGIPDFIKENPDQYENILLVKDKDKDEAKEREKEQQRQQEDARKGARGTKEDGKVKFRLDFQAVFIPDSSAKVSMILPQLAFHDIENVVLLGTNLWHDKSLVENAAGYTDNAVITSGFYPESRVNSKARHFARDYESLYGKPPGFIEAVAYDSASIVLESLLDESIKSRKGLRDYLAGGMVFNGATGKTYFDRKGDLHKELFYLTIKGNDFIEIRSSAHRE